MAGLSTLPDDLILLVLLYVPNNTLLSVTTVSRALRRCSISKLYRFVYLWERHDSYNPEYQGPNVPDWKSRYQHLGKPPSYATRIFNLSLFLRTITESEQLRSYVTGASFACLPDQEISLLPVIQLLRPSLSHLHVKCTLRKYHENKALLSAASCLEVEISESCEDYRPSEHLLNDPYNEDIHSYFDPPNIRLLSLWGVRDWNFFVRGSAKKSSTLSITSLCLTNTVPADQGLAKFLSWPRALKSLRYELQTMSNGFYDCSLSNPATQLSPSEFGVALQSQARNLEELFIYGDSDGDRCLYAPTETIDLHSFTKLKYVGLHLGFLFISQTEAISRRISVSNTAISRILPPTLEELQIEVTSVYPASSYFSLDPDIAGDVEVRPGEFSAFICETVKNKATRFTGLRSIVVWQQGEGDFPEPPFTLESRQGCAEVVEACKAANVHIRCDKSWVPPAFDS